MTVTGQGRFSLVNNQWVDLPALVDVDQQCVTEKADKLRRTIDAVIEIGDPLRMDGVLKRLRSFRHDGLAEEGEYSLENLLYKELRRDGTLQRLRDAARFQYDDSLSYSRKYGKDSQPVIRLPARDGRYGVGKRMGPATYVHREYLPALPDNAREAAAYLPQGFEFNVVKHTDGPVSFMECADFDSAEEPTVGKTVLVQPDGSISSRDSDQIYHHKWLFVDDDYDGFDVEASKARSAEWMSLPDVDKSKIGNKPYWNSQVVPRIKCRMAPTEKGGWVQQTGSHWPIEDDPVRYAEGFPWEDEEDESPGDEPDDAAMQRQWEEEAGGYEPDPDEELESEAPGSEPPDPEAATADDEEGFPWEDEPEKAPDASGEPAEKPKSWADEAFRNWGKPGHWDEKRNQPSAKTVAEGGKERSLHEPRGMTGPEGPGPDATPEAAPAEAAEPAAPAASAAPAAPVPDSAPAGAPRSGTWTPYTGKRGGHGWQNTATGEVVYQDDPPGQRTPASPQDHPLGDLANGTEIAGWTKMDAPAGWANMPGLDSVWSNGEQVLNHEQMQKYNGDEVDAHMAKRQPPATEPSAAEGESTSAAEDPRPSPKKRQPKKGPRAMDQHEEDAVRGVAHAFGIPPGDLHNDRRARNFLRLAARNLGFDPESAGSDETEQAIASAVYLDGQREHLESMVQLAKGYGWTGGRGDKLVLRARNAADHIVRTAARQGYQASGASSHQQVEQALDFLRKQETQQPGDSNPIHDLLAQLLQRPDKIGLGHVVGAVLGFWLMHTMLKRRR